MTIFLFNVSSKTKNLLVLVFNVINTEAMKNLGNCWVMDWCYFTLVQLYKIWAFCLNQDAWSFLYDKWKERIIVLIFFNFLKFFFPCYWQLRQIHESFDRDMTCPKYHIQQFYISCSDKAFFPIPLQTPSFFSVYCTDSWRKNCG